MMMKGLQLHHEAPKRRWDEKGSLIYMDTNSFYQRTKGCAGGGAGESASAMAAAAAAASSSSISPTDRNLLGLSFMDVDDVASAVVPPVTVVLEGRSICHRVQLDKHEGYESLARALRRMFVDVDESGGGGGGGGDGLGRDGGENLDLSNAIPGHRVAYEDIEDDLLLVGDLNWKDFVRVAKRIRIIPANASRRKHNGGA